MLHGASVIAARLVVREYRGLRLCRSEVLALCDDGAVHLFIAERSEPMGVAA